MNVGDKVFVITFAPTNEAGEDYGRVDAYRVVSVGDDGTVCTTDDSGHVGFTHREQCFPSRAAAVARLKALEDSGEAPHQEPPPGYALRVYATFVNFVTPPVEARVAGPFRTFSVRGDVMYVTAHTGHQIRLAVRTPAGRWEAIPFGGAEYDHVEFRPAPSDPFDAEAT